MKIVYYNPKKYSKNILLKFIWIFKNLHKYEKITKIVELDSQLRDKRKLI